METASQEPKQKLLECLARFQGDLLRRGKQLTGSEPEARDLVQDTCERALRAARVPSEVEEMRCWLLRTLTNLFIDRLRAKKRRRIVPLSDQIAATASFADEPSRRFLELSITEVHSALGQVPEPLRSAYRAHVIEGRSYAQLAAELGVGTATVGTRIFRARQYLRNLLEHRTRERPTPDTRYSAQLANHP
jgi:RNA polymerase sigma-70 factor (ECF subfamily)